MPRFSKRSLSTFVAAVGATFSTASGGLLAIQRPPEVPSASERRSPRAPDTFAPMTLVVTTTSTPAGVEPRVTRQTVLRTADRVLVMTEGTKSEWLFERNPLDHRRVSGYLIDHETNRIPVHQESDLRNGQHIRGWIDVLTLRFDPDTLRDLRRTGESKRISSLVFDRFVAVNPSHRSVAEVWWSEPLLLPGRIVVRDRDGATVTTSTLDEVDDGVDGSKLASPAQRFPSYRMLEVTDAREP